ncbi:MAG TPA: PKD domain-containing protein, partial [Chitinophagaceae bacterium]
GKAANVPFTITLNKGQIYNVMATTTGTSGGDLTGSKIRSVSAGAGGCKRIAVFSGSGKINIGCNNGSADNLIQQVFPKNAWGRKYLTTPTQSQSNNYFRIAVTDPTTVVKRNGTVLTGLNGGFYYQYTSNTPDLIEADKAVLVAQYSTTQGCAGNGTPGDPEMIYISPVEQTINRITLNSTPNYNITAHYINVVIKNGGISSFKLDGISKASSFTAHPKDAAYSYAAFPVSSGSHTLYSDSGFNAIAYGYGAAESYGYNAGTNVIDLYQYITLRNQYATVNFPATCVEAPFRFSITLPYQPVRIKWDFNNSPSISPNAAVQLDPPAGLTTIPPDSSFVKDGKDLYVYQLPTIYQFNTTGTFPIKVVVNNPTPDGCSGEQDIDYDVVVYPKPVANWSIASNPCLKEPLQFNDATNGNGRPVILWNWEFGDGTGSAIPNPVKTFDTARSYNVRIQAITDIGCITDTIKPFVVHAPPVALFSVDSPRCLNSVITFTDQSTIASGSISKWYWNLGNGNSITATSNAPLTQTYVNTGTYNVTLQTESAVGCKSTVTPMQLVVSPNPVVEFQTPAAVCLPVGTAPFFNQSTIADGSESQFGYQWEFGDGGTSTQKDPVHYYTATGNYNVKLSVTSNAGCIQQLVKPFNTVYERPTASFTSAAEICLRDSLHLVSNSSATGQSINSWSWYFGDGNVSSMADPTHLYTSADTFNVRLYVESDKGCRSDTMIRPVIVNPLPVAAFIHSAPVCETKNILFTSQSVASVGSLTNWHWNFGDGGVNDRTDDLPFTHVFDTAGTYTVKLAVKSSKGCMSDTVPATIIARYQPFANFIKPEVCLDDSYA